MNCYCCNTRLHYCAHHDLCHSSRVSVVDTILNEDMDAYTRLTDSILHQILEIPAAVEVDRLTLFVDKIL